MLVWGDGEKNPNFPKPLGKFDIAILTGEQSAEVLDAVNFFVECRNSGDFTNESWMLERTEN